MDARQTRDYRKIFSGASELLAIFLEIIPFFAVISLGFVSGKTGFFDQQATAYLTKFVFYFALSALIFGFASTLDVGAFFHWPFVWAYLLGSGLVYLLAIVVASLRKTGLAEAAVEAQCAVVGNVGFLGIPLLAAVLGPKSVGFVMLVLACDLIVFGSLIVVLITGSRDGRMSVDIVATMALGLVKNPMIVSMVLGLLWARTGYGLPGPVDEFLKLLGAAATPGALFAIGASLAGKSAERPVVAGWLSFAKLFLHPAAVAFAALVLFDVDPFGASVMIACAAMPVAGNVFMLAQHYEVAPMRVSASILISTAVSVITLSLVIAAVFG